jgi:hypothetical protein
MRETTPGTAIGRPRERIGGISERRRTSRRYTAEVVARTPDEMRAVGEEARAWSNVRYEISQVHEATDRTLIVQTTLSRTLTAEGDRRNSDRSADVEHAGKHECRHVASQPGRSRRRGAEQHSRHKAPENTSTSHQVKSGSVESRCDSTFRPSHISGVLGRSSRRPVRPHGVVSGGAPTLPQGLAHRARDSGGSKGSAK